VDKNIKNKLCVCIPFCEQTTNHRTEHKPVEIVTNLTNSQMPVFSNKSKIPKFEITKLQILLVFTTEFLPFEQQLTFELGIKLW
jgi:hypothetical protein